MVLRKRQVLAVMLVATALCADRAAAASSPARLPEPQLRVSFARKVIRQLSKQMCRPAAVVLRRQMREVGQSAEAAPPTSLAGLVACHAFLSPLQLRLPPPSHA